MWNRLRQKLPLVQHPARALAFNNAGDLFVAEYPSGGSIIEITPGDVQSTFASGLPGPYVLAFNSVGDLFEGDGDASIHEFAPGYVNGDPLTTFASSVSIYGLAFDSAGNLFTASSSIYEFAPGYVNGDPLTTFVSAANALGGMAFNSAGDLFTTDSGNGIIYEITPGGAESIFASGLTPGVTALAFNSASDLFVADGSDIYEFAPGYVNGDPLTIFASGLITPMGLAFQGETLPVPEPSTWALLGTGMAALFGFRRRNRPRKKPVKHVGDDVRSL